LTTKIEAKIFTCNYWGRGEPLCPTLLTVALSPSHSNKTRSHPWSPFAKGNHLDCAEKVKNFLIYPAPLNS